ncbi:unnamed protein product [Effrenium voratum]|uniref:LRAT domain-containing protein n=1 Tax=Effrenium voratum TaxID=2562239 RepID=A0AA36JDN1_9DINO|nr:unnamed protein product [Effrenium voratum]
MRNLITSELSPNLPKMGQSMPHSVASSDIGSSNYGEVGLVPPGLRLEDYEVQNVVFVEKAVFACPLPGKAWIELGRWNPVSLLFLVPAWSYHVSGPADHWWFVARSANNMYFYAAQFCMDESGKNHVSGCVYLGLCAAVASGLQYPEAQWWFAREWAPCRKPRSKKELDRLLLNNPSAMLPYSWMDNNCQHFAVNLYEGDPGHIA